MKKPFEEIIKNFLPSGDGKLDSLLKFTALAEEMAAILRRTNLADGSRRQNDAEHSWRIALMALIFKEYFIEEVDATRAATICLAHDLVEIYAGDTFAYDAAANVGKEERELAAADKKIKIGDLSGIETDDIMLITVLPAPDDTADPARAEYKQNRKLYDILLIPSANKENHRPCIYAQCRRGRKVLQKGS